MRLVLHPKVYSDIDRIMDYYERLATSQLANEFYAELRSLMAEAAAQPEYFSIRKGDIRRANLRRFPYHFLFRIVEDVVRILVVRHHSRHPAVGTERR
jgi:toxin ParE1/3/4